MEGCQCRATYHVSVRLVSPHWLPSRPGFPSLSCTDSVVAQQRAHQIVTDSPSVEGLWNMGRGCLEVEGKSKRTGVAASLALGKVPKAAASSLR